MAEPTLKEYATPYTEEPQAIIVYPTVEGNNFEIKPAQLNLVQQNQLSGSPTEDPNLHISSILRLCKKGENQEKRRVGGQKAVKFFVDKSKVVVLGIWELGLEVVIG
ncbi:hypothetical protein MTR_2g460950 [Medicago truncatula]|uniref:Uncharacterized protein n=1 Tax=Medicago truncatula TaxID=3880 RepID=A0A072VIU8_MEDTR|nr:hypothetical protein MTR_2g460950 [Medicago truncatula]